MYVSHDLVLWQWTVTVSVLCGMLCAFVGSHGICVASYLGSSRVWSGDCNLFLWSDYCSLGRDTWALIFFCFSVNVRVLKEITFSTYCLLTRVTVGMGMIKKEHLGWIGESLNTVHSFNAIPCIKPVARYRRELQSQSDRTWAPNLDSSQAWVWFLHSWTQTGTLMTGPADFGSPSVSLSSHTRSTYSATSALALHTHSITIDIQMSSSILTTLVGSTVGASLDFNV